MDRAIRSLADVDVYRIARALARDINREIEITSSATAENGPFGHLQTLSQAICRNIADEFEEQRSGSHPDFGGFLLRAKVACGELAVWVACLRAQGLLSSARAESWDRSCARISGILESLYAYKPPTVAEAA